MTRQSFGVFFFLHLCIALFFIVLGMEGFFFRNSSDVAMVAGKLAGIFGGESAIYLILISILEIVCGVVMLVSLVTPVGAGFLRVSILVSMLLWLTVIILKDVIGASVLTDFPVGVIRWLRPFILDVVLLLTMWTVRVRG
ncbi:MAG: hypothetical protein SOZ27_07275 [Spirochaetia bacterium]|nr:hypothetical protein [Spirochaetia bacterium]